MKLFRTTGTCSEAIRYEVTDGVVTACQFVGGCPGNTQAVAKLVIGKKVEEVIALLKGIPCRNGTSCPDQLARALEAERQPPSGVILTP
ncbi:MAG: TIGR03905 family TSCPD domain-containing protein [Kiritimatiellae bacterium]|nr:TIGR03905 family TSCPD domain-containing protein [Kiritimatiellia bacterium]